MQNPTQKYSQYVYFLKIVFLKYNMNESSIKIDLVILVSILDFAHLKDFSFS